MVDDLNGFSEIGGLETGGEEGFEEARVVEALVEIVAVDFGELALEIL